MDLSLKAEADKLAETKKHMTALRDLKLSFAERAKHAEAAQAAAEQKLTKVTKELRCLRHYAGRFPYIARCASNSNSSSIKSAQSPQNLANVPAGYPGETCRKLTPGNKGIDKNGTCLTPATVCTSGKTEETAPEANNAKEAMAPRQVTAEDEQVCGRVRESEVLTRALENLGSRLSQIELGMQQHTQAHTAPLEQRLQLSQEHAPLQWQVTECAPQHARESHYTKEEQTTPPPPSFSETLEFTMAKQEGARQDSAAESLLYKQCTRRNLGPDKTETSAKHDKAETRAREDWEFDRTRLEREVAALVEACEAMGAREVVLIQENTAMHLQVAALRVLLKQAQDECQNTEGELAQAQILKNKSESKSEIDSGSQRHQSLWMRITELQAENAALRGIETGQQRIAALEALLKFQLVKVQNEIIECTRDLSCVHEDMEVEYANLDVTIGEHCRHQHNLENENEEIRLRIDGLLQHKVTGRDASVMQADRVAHHGIHDGMHIYIYVYICI